MIEGGFLSFGCTFFFDLLVDECWGGVRLEKKTWDRSQMMGKDLVLDVGCQGIFWSGVNRLVFESSFLLNKFVFPLSIILCLVLFARLFLLSGDEVKYVWGKKIPTLRGSGCRAVTRRGMGSTSLGMDCGDLVY
jgi:hypothetical protein